MKPLQEIFDTEEIRKMWMPYYQVPGRIYHTEKHIFNMFWHAETHEVVLSDAQSLAILMHDTICIPGYKYNEEASKALVPSALANAYITLPQYVITDAQSYIQDTKDHNPLSPESAMVCDLDLLGFMFHPVENAIKVKVEWRYIKDSDVYRIGRTDFLKRMLRRTPFYHTDVFGGYSERAKENIETELNTLVNH